MKAENLSTFCRVLVSTFVDAAMSAPKGHPLARAREQLGGRFMAVSCDALRSQMTRAMLVHRPERLERMAREAHPAAAALVAEIIQAATHDVLRSAFAVDVAS